MGFIEMDIHHDTTWWVSFLILIFGLLGSLSFYLMVSWTHRGWSAWRTRGCRPGRFYCAACRFDLRHLTRAHCPECGAMLEGRGLLCNDRRPPLPRWIDALLYSALGLTVLSALLWGVGTYLPSNYSYRTSGDLKFGLANPTQGPLGFSLYLKGTFNLSGDPVPDDEMKLYIYDWSNPNSTGPGHAPILHPPPLRWRDPKAVDQFWETIVAMYPTVGQRPDHDALKAGYQNYVTALGDQTPPSDDVPGMIFNPIRMRAWHDPLVNPWYAVPCGMLLVATAIFLFVSGLRQGSEARDAHEAGVAMRTQTFLKECEINRLKVDRVDPTTSAKPTTPTS